MARDVKITVELDVGADGRSLRNSPIGTVSRARGPQRPSEHVFMQEELFGLEEYRQVIAYHYRNGAASPVQGVDLPGARRRYLIPPLPYLSFSLTESML
jgi:hypothetical protein